MRVMLVQSLNMNGNESDDMVQMPRVKLERACTMKGKGRKPSTTAPAPSANVMSVESERKVRLVTSQLEKSVKREKQSAHALRETTDDLIETTQELAKMRDEVWVLERDLEALKAELVEVAVRPGGSLGSGGSIGGVDPSDLIAATFRKLTYTITEKNTRIGSLTRQIEQVTGRVQMLEAERREQTPGPTPERAAADRLAMFQVIDVISADDFDNGEDAFNLIISTFNSCIIGPRRQ